MIEMGIIDPLRVCRSALQNGASVAGLLLTTNTLVAEEQTPWGGSRGADDRVRPAGRGPAPAVAGLQHAAVARARPVGRAERAEPPAARRRRRSARRRRRPAPVAGRRTSRTELLRSRGPGARACVALLGPAFVAAVAYIDPGNFATNFSAGARLRVRAGLGHRGGQPDGDAGAVPVGEGRRRHRPGPAGAVPGAPAAGRSRVGLWVQAELIAMATDLAEFVGAAVGLNLLFGVPLLPAGLITAVVAFGDPGAGAARLPPVRAGDRRAARHRACSGFAYDLVAVGADPGGVGARAWSRASPAAAACCWRPASSARR